MGRFRAKTDGSTAGPTVMKASVVAAVTKVLKTALFLFPLIFNVVLLGDYLLVSFCARKLMNKRIQFA